jgi:hypothetical protein
MTFGLLHFVIFGLVFWLIPSFWVISSYDFFSIISIFIPLIFSFYWDKGTNKSLENIKVLPSSKVQVFMVFCLLYLIIDSAFWRQNFLYNIFINYDAVDLYIQNFNNSGSGFRGVYHFLGGLLIFIPFVLKDIYKGKNFLFFLIIALLIFYQIGISRAYLLIAVISILLTVFRPTFKNIILTLLFALFAFTLMSITRGDYNNSLTGMPLIDGIAYPYINLNLLQEFKCGDLDKTSFEYVLEFLKKFLILGDKEIYRFNYEVTNCIYPSTKEYIDSVSIYTYIGELVSYRPTVITSFLAGVILVFLTQSANNILNRYGLNATKIFSGIMIIALLRSRLQDVFSFLIFLNVFLYAFNVFSRIKIKK